MFLDTLEKLMIERGLNRSDVARGIDVSPSTVNSWFIRESENISLETLRKLARFLNVSLEELINGTPDARIVFSSEDGFTTEFDTHSYSYAELKIIGFFAEFIKECKKNENSDLLAQITPRRGDKRRND